MWRADLNAANAEFNKGTQHLPACNFICSPADAYFDQEAVVVRRDLSACETRAGVEADAITASTAIHFNLSCVWLEVSCCVFSGDTALNCEAALGDRILRQSKLRKSCASCDLNLGGDDVKSGNFLYYRLG